MANKKARAIELIEHPVPNSGYSLLGPANPDDAKLLSLPQRCAMAARILEVGPKLPRYFDRHGAETNAIRAAEQAAHAAHMAAVEQGLGVTSGRISTASHAQSNVPKHEKAAPETPADILTGKSIVKANDGDLAATERQQEIYAALSKFPNGTSVGNIRKGFGKPVKDTIAALIKLGAVSVITY